VAAVIELGRISINHRFAGKEARQKTLTVVERLCGDPMTATRLAAGISEICRRLGQLGREPSLLFEVREDEGKVALNLTFHDQTQIPAIAAAASLFDHVEVLSTAEGSHTLSLSKLLAHGGSLSAGTLSALQEIVQQKGRDELMADLSETNRELRESLENLRRTRFAKERMEDELNIGREIQQSMLPLEFPPFPERNEFSIFATLQPAREVGGDFYDFFFVDNDRLCLSIGDVSGKGVPAALFMAVTRTLIKSTAKNDHSPASILTHVNDELSENNESCMFVTVFTGILDVNTGDFVYTNAGHNPPYIKHADGRAERLGNRHGPIIGAQAGQVYAEDTLRLAKAETLVLYTDGVTEAMNTAEQLYSEGRLASFLALDRTAHAEDAVNRVVVQVKEFEDGAVQADDITVMAIQFEGPSGDSAVRSLELVVQNSLDEIERVNETFNEFSGENDIPDDVRRKCNLVFDELLNNTISYAFPDQKAHEIQVRIELSGRRLVVTLLDDGIPFNPFAREKPDTSLSLEEREIGGLGIHLVRNVMDECSYERRVNQNVVALVKMI
jgi:sigma-B regulation protein RsbU (phosphoserine phosphatase)